MMFGAIMLPKPSCSHPDAVNLFEVCSHLWENRKGSASGKGDYYRCFSGSGLDRSLLCKACDEIGSGINTPKVSICEECFLEMEEGGQRIGDWGVPGYKIRDAGLQMCSTTVSPLPDAARVVRIAPIHAASGSHWLVLTDRNELLRIDFVTEDCRRISGVAELGLPIDVELSLVVSKSGVFAVIATMFGEIGVVIEITSGKVTMALKRGDYRNEHCRFPAAFFEHDGETLLVHATDWNRLDISDPRTGRLLTPRAPTAFVKGEEMPPHYLDYFHCGLAISSNNEWIADNGWVWSPHGVVSTWSLRNWLIENIWESEDGVTKRSDVSRSYYWDGPLCWLNNCQLAAWGVGQDDYSLLPAVRVVDVTNGNEHPSIIGPFGPTEPATTPEAALQNTKLAVQGVLEFDHYLFAWSGAAGFTAWDIVDGARVFEEKTFCPLAYNRATQQFFSQDSAGTCRLSRLVFL